MNSNPNDAGGAPPDIVVTSWAAAREEVANLASHGPNWDGEGAVPIRPGLLAATLRLFQALAGINLAPFDVYLAPDGTVVSEWHFSRGSVTIVNVRVTDHAEVTYRSVGKNPQFGIMPIPPSCDGPPVPTEGANEPISSFAVGAYQLAVEVSEP